MHRAYGIDIGSCNFKMYSDEENRFLSERNIIAMKKKSGILDFGDEAFEIYEKSPENVILDFPVKGGVIANINNMYMLFEKFYKKINSKKVYSSANFCIAVPTDITEVEKRAFFDLIAESAVKARSIYVVEKPVADGVGIGLDVKSSEANLIIDIGSETSEISVISMGGIVVSKLLNCGGSNIDTAICNAVKSKLNLVIGMKSAELIKIKLADAINSERKSVIVQGRNLLTGLPDEKEVTSDFVFSVIEDKLQNVFESAKIILERTPPELFANIKDNGLYITGGSSQIKNLDIFASDYLGLNVNTCRKPALTVIKGISKIISDKDLSDLMYIPREKMYL